jgi:hypothetical protein
MVQVRVTYLLLSFKSSVTLFKKSHGCQVIDSVGGGGSGSSSTHIIISASTS